MIAAYRGAVNLITRIESGLFAADDVPVVRRLVRQGQQIRFLQQGAGLRRDGQHGPDHGAHVARLIGDQGLRRACRILPVGSIQNGVSNVIVDSLQPNFRAKMAAVRDGANLRHLRGDGEALNGIRRAVRRLSISILREHESESERGQLRGRLVAAGHERKPFG